ncbi:MAG: cyclic peptide export ABC transporter, partial [Burkholderiaceae bacterium]
MAYSTNVRTQARELFQLLRPFLPWMVLSALTGVGAGAATVALLAVINRVLSGGSEMTGEVLLSFVGLCGAALAGRAISNVSTNRIGQRLVGEVRLNLARKILSAPIDTLERYRTHRLMPVLTQDVDMISDVIFDLAATLVAAVTVAGCLGYLAYLSPRLFGFLMVALVLGSALQLFAQARGVAGFWKAREHEEELHKAYRDISAGAKELRMHRERRTRLLSGQVERTIAAIRDVNSRAINTYVIASAFGSALYFLLIALILGWASVRPTEPGVLSGFVLMLLFLKGPVDQLLGALPEIGRAKVAFQRIADLSGNFTNPEPHLHLSRPTSAAALHSSIELRDVRYAFDAPDPSAPGFVLGPVNLRFERGDLVFIVGDNGSGKTTLIKVLLGLYAPQDGEILIDGVPVTVETRDDYRQLFTTVFADFYLFEDLLSGKVDELGVGVAEEALTYLERLEIAHKVSIKDGTFSTLDLSTGQRKRLALVHAYVEGRPILVFDEWAADQDPTFRHLFYTELLPELKSNGHLVIAISHDDRYFHLADRVVRMAEGRIIEDRKASSAAAAKLQLAARGEEGAA